MRIIDFEEIFFRLILSVVFLGVFILCLAGVAAVGDTLLERRAFPAIAACHQARQEPLRQFLSTTVRCVPAYRATKNDTLTVAGLK